MALNQLAQEGYLCHHGSMALPTVVNSSEDMSKHSGAWLFHCYTAMVTWTSTLKPAAGKLPQWQQFHEETHSIKPFFSKISSQNAICKLSKLQPTQHFLSARISCGACSLFSVSPSLQATILLPHLVQTVQPPHNRWKNKGPLRKDSRSKTLLAQNQFCQLAFSILILPKSEDN